MNQRRALQGVIRPFGLKVVVGETPQLFVDQRHESVEGFSVALCPVVQKLGELTGLIFGYGHPSPLPEAISSIFEFSPVVNLICFLGDVKLLV